MSAGLRANAVQDSTGSTAAPHQRGRDVRRADRRTGSPPQRPFGAGTCRISLIAGALFCAFDVFLTLLAEVIETSALSAILPARGMSTCAMSRRGSRASSPLTQPRPTVDPSDVQGDCGGQGFCEVAGVQQDQRYAVEPWE